MDALAFSNDRIWYLILAGVKKRIVKVLRGQYGT